MLKNIEKYFWLIFIFALIIGISIPYMGFYLTPLIKPMLMFVLFLTFLKVDTGKVFLYLKKPLFIFYILFVYLLVVPVIVYFIFRYFGKDIAVGFLLLATMPPGVASPALTDIAKGNTSLSLAISIIAYVVAPFTVIFNFMLLTGTSLTLNLPEMFQVLLMFMFVPLFFSQLLKKYKSKMVNQNIKYFGAINIITIGLILYTVVSTQSKNIIQNPVNIIKDLTLLYIFFILLHIIGYVIAFWRKKEDKIAISISKTYMNNSLAVVLAFSFFSPPVVLITVLSEFPWSTLLGGFKVFLKKL